MGQTQDALFSYGSNSKLLRDQESVLENGLGLHVFYSFFIFALSSFFTNLPNIEFAFKHGLIEPDVLSSHPNNQPTAVGHACDLRVSTRKFHVGSRHCIHLPGIATLLQHVLSTPVKVQLAKITSTPAFDLGQDAVSVLSVRLCSYGM